MNWVNVDAPCTPQPVVLLCNILHRLLPSHEQDEFDLQYTCWHELLLQLLLLLHRWNWSAVHRLPLVTTTTATTTQVSLICSTEADMGSYHNCYYYTDEFDLHSTGWHGSLRQLLLLHRWVWSAVHRQTWVTTTNNCYYYTDEFDLHSTGWHGYYDNCYYYTDEFDLQYIGWHGLLVQLLLLHRWVWSAVHRLTWVTTTTATTTQMKLICNI